MTKMKWIFPAVVRGTQGRSKVVKRWLVGIPGEFDIAETSADSMPLAALAENMEGHVPDYRAFDGKLYRPFLDGEEFSDFAEAKDVLAYGFNPIYFALSHEVFTEIRRPDRIPMGSKEGLESPDKGVKSLDELGVTLADGADDDIAYWRGRMENTLSRWLLVDGAAWTAGGDPVYVVDTENRSLDIMTTELYPGSRHRPPDNWSDPSGEHGMKHRVFSATDWEGVIELGNAIGAEVGNWTPCITVVDADQFGSDIHMLELDRFARLLITHVSDKLKKMSPNKRETYFEAAPTSLITGWMSLRDLLKSYDPLEAVDEHLETVLRSFVDEAVSYRESVGFNLLSREFSGNLEDYLDRWDRRRISIAPEIAPAL